MAHLDLQTGTYAAADTLLGGRDSRRIGHNTTLRRTGADIAVRYHSTDIVTLSADGWLTVDTGGWQTVTTWQRINALLPGRWAVHSDRGTSWLYHGGHPITPYADGLAVHVGYSSGGGTGAVGMNGATLLTAEDVAGIETAHEIATAARAEKRAARLLREHPTAFGPRTHSRSLYDQRARDCAHCNTELAAERAARQAVLSAEHESVTAYAAATSAPSIPASWAGTNPSYDASGWPESARIAAGSHATHRTDSHYPMLMRDDGTPDPYRHDYGAAPTVTERYTVACPWECPDRPRHW